MEDPGHYHSGSSGPPARIKTRSMNLQKCDFCRDRKVRVSDALVFLLLLTVCPTFPLQSGVPLKTMSAV